MRMCVWVRVCMCLCCVCFFSVSFSFPNGTTSHNRLQTYKHSRTHPPETHIVHTHSKWYQWRHNAHCCAANSLLRSPTRQATRLLLRFCFSVNLEFFCFVRFVLDFLYIITSLFILGWQSFCIDRISYLKKWIKLSQYNEMKWNRKMYNQQHVVYNYHNSSRSCSRSCCHHLRHRCCWRHHRHHHRCLRIAQPSAIIHLKIRIGSLNKTHTMCGSVGMCIYLSQHT